MVWLTPDRDQELQVQKNVQDDLKYQKWEHGSSFHTNDAGSLVVDIADSPEETQTYRNHVWKDHSKAIE